MSTQSSLRRWRVALGLALGVVALIVPTAAHATSTTVAPAGDIMKIGSFSFELEDETISRRYPCKVTDGTAEFKIPAEPANHNASGPVTVQWIAGEMTISCEHKFPLFIEITNFTPTFQGGSPSTVNIAVSFNIESEGMCAGETEKSAFGFHGNWTNGTTSPFVNSSLLGEGSIGFSSGCPNHFNLTGKFTKGEKATIPMEDKTKPTSVIKVTT